MIRQDFLFLVLLVALLGIALHFARWESGHWKH